MAHEPDSKVPIPESSSSTETHSVGETEEKAMDTTLVPINSLEAGDTKEKECGEEEEDQIFLSPLKVFLVTFALCLANFCIGLDNSIITTAIPKITDEFRTLKDVGWYGSAYLMTLCAFQPIYGKIYTLSNTKWTFLSAVIIFEVGSVLCAAARSSAMFIVGRAIAGIGGAGLFTGGVMILRDSVPLSTMPLYIGILGMVFGTSSIAGPLLGGAFTENPKLTWRWCFYINLPLGLVTLLVIQLLFVPRPKTQSSRSTGNWLKQLDPLGVALLLAAIITLILALSWGGAQYTWSSARVILCLVASISLTFVFGIQQKRKGADAVIPLSIIKRRSIIGAAFYGFAQGGTYCILIYYIPLWFQVVKEVSAIKSGIMNIPLISSVILFLFISGAFTTKTGWYTQFFWLSGILMSVGSGLCTTWKVDSGAARWVTDQLIAGIGLGLGIQQPLTVAQESLSPADVPVGIAFVMFTNGLGSAVMLSVGQNVFANKIVRNVGAVTTVFDPRIILTTGATQLKSIIPHELYPRVIRAYSKSITETFYVGLALALISLLGTAFVPWKRAKDQKQIIDDV